MPRLARTQALTPRTRTTSESQFRRKAMRNTVVKVVLVLALVVAGIGVFSAVASAGTACYVYDQFPSERLMIKIGDDGTLVSGQKAYEIRGKEVGGCGGGTIAGAYGVVIVNTNAANQPIGAHMSFQDGF